MPRAGHGQRGGQTGDTASGDDEPQPSGFAYVPRGTVHNFRNSADTPSRILIGFTPSGMDGCFRQAGRRALDDGPRRRSTMTRSPAR